MNEIATLNARKQDLGAGYLAAVFALHDDGTVTRQITAIDGVTVANQPAVFRRLDEAERRINCADRLSAIGFLAGVVAAEGWMVAS